MTAPKTFYPNLQRATCNDKTERMSYAQGRREKMVDTETENCLNFPIAAVNAHACPALPSHASPDVGAMRHDLQVACCRLLLHAD